MATLTRTPIIRPPYSSRMHQPYMTCLVIYAHRYYYSDTQSDTRTSHILYLHVQDMYICFSFNLSLVSTCQYLFLDATKKIRFIGLKKQKVAHGQILLLYRIFDFTS